MSIDLRVRQLELQVSPKFSHHDALLLTLGAYLAVVVGLVTAWVQS